MFDGFLPMEDNREFELNDYTDYKVVDDFMFLRFLLVLLVETNVMTKAAKMIDVDYSIVV